MYDITTLQIYNYFFKSSSSFDEIGKGGESPPPPPLVLNFQGSIRMSPIFIVQYLDLSLSLECLTKGVTKWSPLLNESFKHEQNGTDSLNES